MGRKHHRQWSPPDALAQACPQFSQWQVFGLPCEWLPCGTSTCAFAMRGSTRSRDEVPELQALRSSRGAATCEVQDALAPYWETWKDQPQKATVVLRRLAEEKMPLALVVLECMGLNQVEINIRHWNPVIFEMSKTNDWQRSLELLLLAMSSRILPDIQSFSSICNAASKAEAWQLATDALQEMFRLQLQVDERIHNIVASSCKSQWLVAMHVLDEMKSTGLGPDAISFSTVCSALSDAAWPLALGLLEAAGRHAVEVDVTNYGATIDVLDEWQQVMWLLHDVKQAGLQVNLPGLNTIAKRCGLASTFAMCSSSLNFVGKIHKTCGS